MDEVWKLFKHGFLMLGIFFAGSIIWGVMIGTSLAVLYILMMIVYAIAKTVYFRMTGVVQ